MNKILLTFIAGLIFGFGLILSGMTNPSIVLGFLDITGAWNPALMFVMVGALIVAGVGYRIIFKRPKPLYAEQFALPEQKSIDAKLLLGAAFFDIGWGLVGLCPGPAITGLSTGKMEIVIFVAAMFIGMYGHKMWSSNQSRTTK